MGSCAVPKHMTALTLFFFRIKRSASAVWSVALCLPMHSRTMKIECVMKHTTRVGFSLSLLFRENRTNSPPGFDDSQNNDFGGGGNFDGGDW